MAGGQSLPSGQGTVTYGLTVALVGLALTATQGIVTATGSDAAGLTGQGITSAQGAPVHSASVQLVGRVAVLDQGAVFPRGRSLIASFDGTTTPEAQIPLAGQAVTGSQGVVAAGPEGSPALSGQALISAQQALSATLAQALTGSELTGAHGTFSLGSRPLTFTGQATTSEQGAVDPSGFTVTAHLSGLEFTASAGLVDATPVLTGAAITSAAGTVVHSQDVALSGLELVAAQGPTIVEQNADDLFIQSQQGATAFTMTVPLVGAELTGTQGTITLNDGEQGIIGSETTSEIGDVAVDISCELLGLESVTAQYPMGAPGYGALTGQAIIGQQGDVFTDNDRTAGLTGVSLTAAQGALVANLRQSLTSALLNSSTGNMGRSGGNMQQALTGHAMVMARGTFGVIGQNPVQQTPSLEGCGVTSGVAVESVDSSKTASSEGCFITSGSANEVA